VCVKVTDMRGVDLTRYRFDYDLTFCALLLSSRGEVLRRYGGREHGSADARLGLESWERALRAALGASWSGQETRVTASEPLARPAWEEAAIATSESRALEDVPAFERVDKGACIHCHSVFPALRTEARARELWRAEDLWVYPSPARVGLVLEAVDARTVSATAPGSAAARAGLMAGDRLLRVGAADVATFSDVQAALHAMTGAKEHLEVALQRGQETLVLRLELEQGWKRATPLEFSWRPSKWELVPAPGFGGRVLPRAERARLGLDPEGFAFRVGYLVTWGDKQRFGRAARAAGLREGDVFLGVELEQGAEVPVFETHDHFHAWWRLTREPGEVVTVRALRAGRQREFELTVLP